MVTGQFLRYPRTAAVAVAAVVSLTLFGPFSGTAEASPCGGTALATPFATGPVSQTNYGATGNHRRYSYKVLGNVGTPVFVEVKGYDEHGVKWYPRR